jgi:hypothetical protein
MSTPVYAYLQLIKSVLEEVRTSKGYETDLGAMVTLEPTQQLGDGGQRIVLLQTQYGPSSVTGLRNQARTFAFHAIAQVSRAHNDAQLRLHRAQSDIDLCLSNTDLLRSKFQLGAARPFPILDDSAIASQVEGVDWVGVALRYTATLRIR